MIISVTATPLLFVQIFQFAIEHDISMKEAYDIVNSIRAKGGKRPVTFRREYILPALLTKKRNLEDAVVLYDKFFGDEVEYAKRACAVDGDRMAFFFAAFKKIKGSDEKMAALNFVAPYDVAKDEKEALIFGKEVTRTLDVAVNENAEKLGIEYDESFDTKGYLDTITKNTKEASPLQDIYFYDGEKLEAVNSAPSI